jgi:hypothetical protein
MSYGNETQITPPRVSLVDERTGAVSREWYRWFYSLFTTLGSGTGIIPVTSGGTGLGTIPINGQLLIGNGSGYTLNTLGFGAGISVTNGAGTITVANTGVLSFSGGATGLTPAAATAGVVTLAGTLIAANGGTGFSSYAVGDLLYANTATTLAKLPDVATGNALISGGVATAPAWGKIGLTTHVSGVLPIANGGTNGAATPTAYGVAYGTGTAYAFTAAGTTGQVLTATTGGAPTWASPATSGTVTSVSGTGTVNGITLTGTVTSTGSLTLGGTLSGVSLTTQVSGTLPVSNGGSGATTLTGYVKGNGASAFTAAASVPAADVSGLATVATSGSFSNLSNKPGVQSNGQNVIGASTTLGSGDKGTNILIVTSGITITFPSSGYASGEGVAISNVSGGTVTLSAPGGSDFGTVLLNNGSVLVFCDGGGFWRQYCYSITRL